MTPEQFQRMSQEVRAGTAQYGDDVRVHGSRAAGTARPDSDVDIAVRVPEEKFDQAIQERFGKPNPGSAKERTMQNAVKTGKIQSGEAGLRGLRQRVERDIGREVDISVIKIDGPFDNGPWIPLK
jgi:predicted nucleotidyltransferase